MRLIELLRLFRDLPIGKILDLPNFADKEACRAWLLAVCEAGTILATKTENAADDAVMKFLADAVANQTLFDPLYEWILALLDGADDKKTMLPPTLAFEADKCGVDPLTIIGIIQAVVAIIKAIRDLRK